MPSLQDTKPVTLSETTPVNSSEISSRGLILLDVQNKKDSN